MKLTEFDFGHFIYVCVYCVIVIALRSDSDCNKQATYQLILTCNKYERLDQEVKHWRLCLRRTGILSSCHDVSIWQ